MGFVPNDDDLDPTARVSAMWWSQDDEVVAILCDQLPSQALKRDSWQAVKVRSSEIIERDAVARQAALEDFLFEVARILNSVRVPGRSSGLVGVGELRVHLALSGPELARGVVFDPASLSRLLPFALSIYID